MKSLPFVPRLKARVRYRHYTVDNGQTVTTLCEGTVIDRFEEASLCCVRLDGGKSSGQWLSARFVTTIARKA